MSARGEVTDVMIGTAVMGVRIGGESARAAIACGRLATRVPVLGGPLRSAVGRVAADGERTRAEGLRRIDAEVDRTVTALLEHPRTRELVEAAVANPALRQMILDAVDSTLTVDVTDHVLQGPAMQHAIEHLASSPELRRAVAEQSAGMAQQTLETVRRRSVTLDDATERTVRGWLRRPRPQTI
jgi:hypothetical protein